MSTRIAALLAALLVAVAAHAQDRPRQPDPKALQSIFSCMAAGLPKDWNKAWVVVRELGNSAGEGKFQAEFRYTTSPKDVSGQPLHPCDSRRVAREVYGLNHYLSAEQQNWRSARLTFTRRADGASYQLEYDYPSAPRRSEAPAK